MNDATMRAVTFFLNIFCFLGCLALLWVETGSWRFVCAASLALLFLANVISLSTDRE